MGKMGFVKEAALSDVYYLYSLKTVIPEFEQHISGIPSLYSDHTRNGVKCYGKNVLSCVVHTISGVVHNAKFKIYS